MRKCLRKRREERYQSTADLVVDLRSLKDNARATTAAIAPPPADEEENLFNTAIRRFFPTPRRWWEVTTLKLLVMQFPVIYLAWRIRQVAVQDWAPAAFLAMVAICIAHGALRAIMMVTAAAAPRELPQRVRSLQPWHSVIAYSQAALWVPLALLQPGPSLSDSLTIFSKPQVEGYRTENAMPPMRTSPLPGTPLVVRGD